jgi:hypothetical protein
MTAILGDPVVISIAKEKLNLYFRRNVMDVKYLLGKEKHFAIFDIYWSSHRYQFTFISVSLIHNNCFLIHRIMKQYIYD